MSPQVPNYATIVTPSTRIGSFETENDFDVLKTYNGTRTSAGGQKTESVSISFDPATLLCITCKHEHPVLRAEKLAIICFSDQNFDAILPAENGDCIAICRLENATLKELVELSFEIFNEVPEGTILNFLFPKISLFVP
jgi:hypothetical protein